MFNLSQVASLSATLLTLGLTASSTFPVKAQTTFPDVPANYWAQPFIRRLAEQNIIVGYPDNTFRPEQTVKRDEFAAMIRQAFEQEQVRQISSGSVYQDVPEGYWAAPAIEEAYQQGFMSGYPNNTFRPNQSVSRVEAIVTLNRGLDLQTQTQQVKTPATTRRTVKRPIYFPLAITSLMRPLIVRQTQTTAAPVTTPASLQSKQLVENYYTDANQIPEYAMNDVEVATQRNLIVNYPNPKVFEPNQPLRRATAAAFIHQSLVALNKMEPLPTNVEAYNYIVRPEINQATR